MKTSITTSDGTMTIAVSGRLDSATSAEFDRSIASSLATQEPPREIIIECSELEYISSAGLRSLITLLKKSKVAGSELRISNLSPAIKSIFDMTGFTSIFNL